MRKEIIKKIIEWWIILIYMLLFYFNFILIERLKIFFIIIFIIWSYVLILNLLSSITNYINKKYEKSKKKEKFLNRLEKILKILLNIFIYRNFIWIIQRIEIKLYFWFRRLNLKLWKYRRIREIIYIIIFGLIIDPIKLLYIFYYRSISSLKKLTIIELMFKRIIGLLLSILVLTYFFNYLILFIKLILNYLNINELYFLLILIILVYLILISISLYTNLIKQGWDEIELLEYEKIEENYIEIKKNLKINLMTINLRGLSIKYTIIGILIDRILYFLANHNRQEIEIKKIKIRDFIFLFNRYRRVYHNIKEGRNTWEYEIIYNILDTINTKELIMKEKKDGIAIWLYIWLYNEFPNWIIQSTIYGMEKYKDNIEIMNELKEYYKKEENRYKYILFLMWDIEKYLKLNENKVIIKDMNIKNNKFIYFWYTSKEYLQWEENNKDLKFIDVKNDYEKYIEIISKIQNQEIEDYYEFVLNRLEKELKLNYEQLIIYHKNEGFGFKPDYSALDEYKKILEYKIEEWRKEWEKEWEEGKRSYLFKNSCI